MPCCPCSVCYSLGAFFCNSSLPFSFFPLPFCFLSPFFSTVALCLHLPNNFVHIFSSTKPLTEAFDTCPESVHRRKPVIAPDIDACRRVKNQAFRKYDFSIMFQMANHAHRVWFAGYFVAVKVPFFLKFIRLNRPCIDFPVDAKISFAVALKFTSL